MATHATPSTLHCLYINVGRDLQLPNQSVNLLYNTAQKREEWGREQNRLVWRLKDKTCQCLLFFDFLWDRCGDLDLERDFLVDFLGVLERDLLDRLGVRGDGDLTGQTGTWLNVSTPLQLIMKMVKCNENISRSTGQMVLPLRGLLVAGSRGIFMRRTGRCVFRVWAVGAFWSLRPFWTGRRWPASSAATPRGAGRPTVTPLPINRRGQISVR